MIFHSYVKLPEGSLFAFSSKKKETSLCWWDFGHHAPLFCCPSRDSRSLLFSTLVQTCEKPGTDTFHLGRKMGIYHLPSQLIHKACHTPMLTCTRIFFHLQSPSPFSTGTVFHPRSSSSSSIFIGSWIFQGNVIAKQSFLHLESIEMLIKE